MKKILLASFVLAVSLSAYEVQNSSVKFTAFKTYAKKGVSGVFDVVKITTHKNNSITGLLNNATATINTTSVNSGNKSRDVKLVSKFFDVQNVKDIEAKIVKVDKKTLIVKITMNEKSLNIPMSYTVNKNVIRANGTIDLADFGMIPSLKSINKACYALHQGKTWQDVDIAFTLNYK